MKYLLIILILLTTSYNISISHPYKNIDNNLKSFGIIEIYAQIKLKNDNICNPIIQSCDKNIHLALFTMNSMLSKIPMLKASSVCIESKINSIFISANHVCKEITDSQIKSDSFKENIKTILSNLKKINPNIKKNEIEILFYSHVKNYEDKKFKIKKVTKTIKEFDLCILEIEGKYDSVSKISNTQPKIGDPIFNIAIPEGIQYKGAIPIFTGIYTGKFKNNISEDSYLLSIPSSQGSSGSPVFNKEGEIIGLIYAAYTNFNHLSISSTLDQVKKLLR